MTKVCNSTNGNCMMAGGNLNSISNSRVVQVKKEEYNTTIIFADMTPAEGKEPQFDKEKVEAIQAWGRYNKAWGKKTVVVLTAPGAAITTPWDKDVDAVLVNFYAGERMAQALTKVLYGDVNPSGKLPMTYPNKPNEQHFSLE